MRDARAELGPLLNPKSKKGVVFVNEPFGRYLVHYIYDHLSLILHSLCMHIRVEWEWLGVGLGGTSNLPLHGRL
jgi:hypothetical protein